MKIRKEVFLTLTPKEVKEILIKHIKNEHGIEITDVSFDVNGHERDGDFLSEQSLDYRLDGVDCKGLIQ